MGDKCLEFTNIEREELVALEVYVQMYVDMRRKAARQQRELEKPRLEEAVQTEVDDEDDSDEDYSPGADDQEDDQGDDDDDDFEVGCDRSSKDEEESNPSRGKSKRPMIGADVDSPTKKSNTVTLLI